MCRHTHRILRIDEEEMYQVACACSLRSLKAPTRMLAASSFLQERREAGEKLSASEEIVVAYSPAPWGTAAGCCKRVPRSYPL